MQRKNLFGFKLSNCTNAKVMAIVFLIIISIASIFYGINQDNFGVVQLAPPSATSITWHSLPITPATTAGSTGIVTTTVNNLQKLANGVPATYKITGTFTTDYTPGITIKVRDCLMYSDQAGTTAISNITTRNSPQDFFIKSTAAASPFTLVFIIDYPSSPSVANLTPNGQFSVNISNVSYLDVSPNITYLEASDISAASNTVNYIGALVNTPTSVTISTAPIYTSSADAIPRALLLTQNLASLATYIQYFVNTSTFASGTKPSQARNSYTHAQLFSDGSIRLYNSSTITFAVSTDAAYKELASQIFSIAWP